jgi:predicted flap endonuclease-1-like 5' DNA nuclease
MAPIPLTLVGILPGHALLGAEFTATSMIGWIALAGIIVRNSILLVDFTNKSVAEGMERSDAVLAAVIARARPILITALALVAGSSVIITDPIFNGMAISLMFGVIVATLLTLFVIPLACAAGAKNENADLSQTPKSQAAMMRQMRARLKSKGQYISLKARAQELAVLAGAYGQSFYRTLQPHAHRAYRRLKNAYDHLCALVCSARSKWLPREEAKADSSADDYCEALWARVQQRMDHESPSQPAYEPAERPVSREPVGQDDLQRIRGIGPKIESVLHQHGLFSYRQIAALSKREIDRIESELLKTNKSAKGRIGRDQWQRQADDLAQGKQPLLLLETSGFNQRPTSSKKMDLKNEQEQTDEKGDDLKQIRGIGRVVEKILRHEGISSFEDLAFLTPAQIERIGRELDRRPRLGRDRIVRDDWIGQARRLLSKERETVY